MSQILDALRRGRAQRFDGLARRAARREAVIATLGYAPARRNRRFGRLAIVLAIALLIALPLIAWIA